MPPTRVSSTMGRVAAGPVLVLIVVVVVLTAINLPVGIAEDVDGHRIVRHALASDTDGFVRSRTSGFPAYELVAYPLIRHLGILSAKIWSMMGAVVAVLALFVVLRGLAVPVRAATLAAACLAVAPTVVTAGSTVMETTQGLALAILSVGTWLWLSESATRGRSALLGIVLGLCVATRPDYVILAGAIAIVTLRYRLVPTRRMVVVGVVFLVTATVPYLIYEDLLPGSRILRDETPAYRLVVGGAAMLGLIGIPGWLVAGITAVRGWRVLRSLSRREHAVVALFGIALAGYLVRLWVLPDEIDYVIVLVPLGILALAMIERRPPAWAALCAAITLSGLVQVHLLDRDALLRPHLSPGLSPGAYVQDRRVIERNAYRAEVVPAIGRSIGDSLGIDVVRLDVSTDEGALVLIPDERLALYRPERRGGSCFRASIHQRIFVYPMAENRGWRKLLRFEDWHPIDLDDVREVAPSEMWPDGGDVRRAATPLDGAASSG